MYIPHTSDFHNDFFEKYNVMNAIYIYYTLNWGLRLYPNIQVSEHKIKGKSITVKKADVKPGKVIIKQLGSHFLSSAQLSGVCG